MTGTARDIDFAAEQKDSLPHARMTEAYPGAMLSGIKTGTIVPNSKLQPAAPASQAAAASAKLT